MFVNVDYKTLINASSIRSIKAIRQPDALVDQAKITLVDGESLVVNRSVEQLEWVIGHIIPAPPGYSVVQAYPPDNEDDTTSFAEYPVLAFRLTGEEPMPIVPVGRLTDNWALVWPDGRCDEPWSRLWPSVEAFKNSFGPNGVRS